MQKEKAPSTAATMQGAYIEQNHKENTTKSPAGQGLFQAATALECLGIELGQTRQLVGLLVENLEQEGTDTMQPERVGMYSDSLWVLADHLRTAKEAVQQDTARLYQERRRVP